MDILERSWEINFIGNDIPKTNYQVRISKEAINPKSAPLSYWLLLKKDNEEVRKIKGNENGSYIVFSKVDFIDPFDSENTTHFSFAVGPLKDIKPENGSQNPRPIINEKDLSLDLTKIALYPNPVKKDQNFTITFPQMESLIISIYDGGGRLLALDKISSSARSYMNHLPIQSSYLINLTQNGKIIKTFKLIVE
nr:T9SS type A sorting domain-containing protein [Chryseobacterium sp. SSA4.19]